MEGTGGHVYRFISGYLCSNLQPKSHTRPDQPLIGGGVKLILDEIYE